MMRLAGVPTVFKPHSVRSAASSAAKDFGIKVEDILAQGRWADKAMWSKYYYRSIERSVPRRRGGNFQEKLRSGV
jgi:hypothetical protein